MVTWPVKKTLLGEILTKITCIIDPAWNRTQDTVIEGTPPHHSNQGTNILHAAQIGLIKKKVRTMRAKV